MTNTNELIKKCPVAGKIHFLTSALRLTEQTVEDLQGQLRKAESARKEAFRATETSRDEILRLGKLLQAAHDDLQSSRSEVANLKTSLGFYKLLVRDRGVELLQLEEALITRDKTIEFLQGLLEPTLNSGPKDPIARPETPQGDVGSNWGCCYPQNAFGTVPDVTY